jgi:hypothetical protein
MTEATKHILEGNLDILGRFGGISSSQVARDAERKRCLQIIVDEIKRAHSLMRLCNPDGSWMFDRGQVEAGVAALEHVLRLIGEESDDGK